jgi:site-specific recombinase XerD
MSSVKSAMEFFLNAKKKIVSKNTIEGYIKDLKVFEEWAEKTRYITKAISTIGTQEVFAFSDFLDRYRREGNDKVGYSKKAIVIS